MEDCHNELSPSKPENAETQPGAWPAGSEAPVAVSESHSGPANGKKASRSGFGCGLLEAQVVMWA